MVCNDWIKLADPTAPTITSLPADLAMTTTWTKFEGDGHINLLLCAQRTVSFVIFFAATSSDSLHQYTRACCARSANLSKSNV